MLAAFSSNGRSSAVPPFHPSSYHTNVIPVKGRMASAASDLAGHIVAYGSLGMKFVSLQYMEAVRRLKDSGFVPPLPFPLYIVYLSSVADEEIGGPDSVGALTVSEVFEEMNARWCSTTDAAFRISTRRLALGGRWLGVWGAWAWMAL